MVRRPSLFMAALGEASMAPLERASVSYFMTSKNALGRCACQASAMTLPREASPFAYRQIRANIAGFLSKRLFELLGWHRAN
jgi:hypothetical protein